MIIAFCIYFLVENRTVPFVNIDGYSEIESEFHNHNL